MHFPRFEIIMGLNICKLHAIDKMWHVKRLLQSWQNRKRSGTKPLSERRQRQWQRAQRFGKMLWMCAPLEPLNRFQFDRKLANKESFMGNLPWQSIDLISLIAFGHIFFCSVRRIIRFNGWKTHGRNWSKNHTSMYPERVQIGKTHRTNREKRAKIINLQAKMIGLKIVIFVER